ncbi:transposon Tf2-6 polyprotein [Nephila pilipes]|uniref:Transposon Tf2-6 polyprotein n=1 Tax=Nephila pilipes TaxID=299642 RepID=A0A8X6U6H5_NEPPI|nr:transposon Tf2-6 polyprotein [Nephila pilipes]
MPVLEHRTQTKAARVINGKEVMPAFKYPWIVKISAPRLCSGSLISEKFVLTSAYCLTKSEMKFLYPTFRNSRKTCIVISAPGTHLQPGISMSFRNVRVYPIPPRNGNQKLREGHMQVVSLKECKPLPKCFRSNSSAFICTRANSKQSPCKGDSGATAFWDVGGGRAYIGLGVTSFPEEEQCEPSNPVTYINIFSYMDWIKKYVKNLPKPYEDYGSLDEITNTNGQRKQVVPRLLALASTFIAHARALRQLGVVIHAGTKNAICACVSSSAIASVEFLLSLPFSHSPVKRTCLILREQEPDGTFALPDARFSQIQIDFIGPFPPSNGQSYCLTIVDRFTRWREVIPTADMTAKTICRALLSVWISRFGWPAIITTDQGTNFESNLFRELRNLLGTNRIRCCDYHSKANGLVERLHRHLKRVIKAHENSQWSEIIPIVLLGMRSAVKKDINDTCAELVYGTDLRLPSDLFSTDKFTTTCNQTYVRFLREKMRSLQPIPTSAHTKSSMFVTIDLKNRFKTRCGRHVRFPKDLEQYIT